MMREDSGGDGGGGGEVRSCNLDDDQGCGFGGDNGDVKSERKRGES